MFSMFHASKETPQTPFYKCQGLQPIALAINELEEQIDKLEVDKNNTKLSRSERRLTNQKYEVLKSFCADLKVAINTFNKSTTPENEKKNIHEVVTKIRNLLDVFVLADMYANIRLLNIPRGFDIKQLKMNGIAVAATSPAIVPPILGMTTTLPVIGLTIVAGIAIAELGLYFFNPKDTKTRSIQILHHLDQAIKLVSAELKKGLSKDNFHDDNVTALDIAPKMAW